MPLETATYISDFVTSNPAASDGLNNADDHMRLIKGVLKNTFPGVTNPVTRGPLVGGLHGFLADAGTAAAPSYSFTGNSALGFYAASFAANQIGISGTLRGNGAVPPGALMDFAVPDANVPTGWLICDGQEVSRATYADLFVAIGTTWGAGNGSTTFNVPPLQDRFRRHRRAGGGTLAGPVGTLQSPSNLSHTHRVLGSTGAADRNLDHTHSGQTGGMTRSNPHTHTTNAPAFSSNLITAASNFAVPAYLNTATINPTDINHEHNFNTNGVNASIDHLHGVDITSQVGSADGTEARPYSASVLTCIKV